MDLGPLLLFIAGFPLLLIGAEGFVRGASSLATLAGVSKLMVGLTVVSIGVSFPEITVALLSTSRASAERSGADLVIGNIVGSNMANILLIGVCAIIRPIKITRMLMRTALPLLVAAQLFLFFVGRDGRVLPREGVGLLLAGVGYIAYTAYYARSVVAKSKKKNASVRAAEQEAAAHAHLAAVRRDKVAIAIDDDDDAGAADAGVMTLTEFDVIADDVSTDDDEAFVVDGGGVTTAATRRAKAATAAGARALPSSVLVVPAVSGVCRGRLSGGGGDDDDDDDDVIDGGHGSGGGGGSSSNSGLIDMSLSMLRFALGLAAMLVGAVWLVDGAVFLARQHNIDELTIGLVIIASGTSLPDLTSSIVATVRGSSHIAIGAALGGSVVNSLIVVGLSSALAPRGLAVSDAARHYDLPCQTILSILLVPIFLRQRVVTRGEGLFLVVCYAAYMYGVGLRSMHHTRKFGEFKLLIETALLPAAMLVGFLAMLWRLWRITVSIEREVLQARLRS